MISNGSLALQLCGPQDARPPTGRITLNKSHPHAKGLRLWVPLFLPVPRDMVTGEVGIFRGTTPPVFSAHPTFGLGWKFTAGSIRFSTQAAGRAFTTPMKTVAIWLSSGLPLGQTFPFFSSYTAAFTVLSDSRVGAMFGTSGNWYLYLPAGTAPLDGSPVHLAFSRRDNDECVVCVNGVKVATCRNAPNDGWAGESEIGDYPTGGYAHNGFIFDARLWNRSMSDGELASLYNPKTRWALCKP